jgi:redox-sensing transcriptional repressor
VRSDSSPSTAAETVWRRGERAAVAQSLPDLPASGDAGRSVPLPAVTRMPVYLAAVESLLAEGISTVSSEALAAACGVGASIVRRDLTHAAPVGRRGVGYDTAELAAAIRAFLRVDRARPLGIVGAGRLGTALAHYLSDPRHGFEIRAVFDADPDRVGQSVGSLTVSAESDFREIARARGLELLVVAVPGSAAQGVTDMVAGTSVTGLLNFAPVPVRAPAGVSVRNVDLATELQVLSHFAPASGGADGEAADPLPANTKTGV